MGQGRFCPEMSGQCPVLSWKCPDFVRFCHRRAPSPAGRGVSLDRALHLVREQTPSRRKRDVYRLVLTLNGLEGSRQQRTVTGVRPHPRPLSHWEMGELNCPASAGRRLQSQFLIGKSPVSTGAGSAQAGIHGSLANSDVCCHSDVWIPAFAGKTMCAAPRNGASLLKDFAIVLFIKPPAIDKCMPVNYT